MLLVLNNVNDNMHQIGITGFHVNFQIIGVCIYNQNKSIVFIIFRVTGTI